MSNQLKISTGQCSDKGRKPINQDFHGLCIQKDPLLHSKGIAIALADGISSSEVSQIASEMAVTSFLRDYYCTSESWSVKTSVQRVLLATNSWLYSQSQNSPLRFNKDKGYVCTFSAMVIKSTTAHLFHVGDSRIYRLSGNRLEQLTEDHRHWISEEKSYLSRALGINQQLDIDYKTLPIEVGDVFFLATDGIYEYASEAFIIESIAQHKTDLDQAAQHILDEAYQQGSDDNLTLQIIRIEQLAAQDINEIHQQLTTLPFPPALEPRMSFDGYKIIREIYISSRSHVYLAVDTETNTQVVLKTPSIDLREDTAYLERFMMEEWIAQRIDNVHILKPCLPTRKRNFLYIVTEFIEGQTLSQWIIDNPKPSIETVRGIIEQISTGLYAFHKKEMLHQDLRPNNIMIDLSGTVKIIDFGSTQVAGLAEISSPFEQNNLLGTAQYTAPEYFLGESGTNCSDLFSLAVMAYQMLTGELPYGTHVIKARTKSAQIKLKYQSILDNNRDVPVWIDEAIKKALHPDPRHRYHELSEFMYDLRKPNKNFSNRTRPPLIEQNPILFWKGLSACLFIIILLLLATQAE